MLKTEHNHGSSCGEWGLAGTRRLKAAFSFRKQDMDTNEVTITIEGTSDIIRQVVDSLARLGIVVEEYPNPHGEDFLIGVFDANRSDFERSLAFVVRLLESRAQALQAAHQGRKGKVIPLRGISRDQKKSAR